MRVMYGLPQSNDLHFLKGRVLKQFHDGVHRLIFKFDLATTISVESRMELIYPSGEKFEWTKEPEERNILEKLKDLSAQTKYRHCYLVFIGDER